MKSHFQRTFSDTNFVSRRKIDHSAQIDFLKSSFWS